MKQYFENYEHLELIPRVYGYCGAFISFLLFLCVHPIVKRWAIPASISKPNEWKWQNILISWCHSTVVGVWVLTCFYLYPEMSQDPIAFQNPLTYGVVAFSTGYFVSDFLDIVVNSQTIALWEVLLHHVGVLSIFIYNITVCRYIGYTNIALLVEVHSISMHLRKLMQMAGISFQNPVYKVNNIINLVMFLGFRYLALVWITYGMIVYPHRMSTTYFYLLGATMLSMWLINTILFWRLLKNDVLRNLKKQHHVAGNNEVHPDVTEVMISNNNDSRRRQTSL